MGLLGLARLNLNLGPRLPLLVGASNKRNIILIISLTSNLSEHTRQSAVRAFVSIMREKRR